MVDAVDAETAIAANLRRRLAAGPGDAVGGAEHASSARYLRTVRQSTPHSRAISA